jgi:hypothetical protein
MANIYRFLSLTISESRELKEIEDSVQAVIVAEANGAISFEALEFILLNIAQRLQST